ncbi:hypothetical protein HanPSC8_Chr03g0094451 [Helianthus annuus]|nr:hypothetical protein HanPSC8_Chr03g0094451 [Helianthus annuus]
MLGFFVGGESVRDEDGGEFWGTRVMEIVKKHDSWGLVWKIIKLTTTRKLNAKKRIQHVWQPAWWWLETERKVGGGWWLLVGETERKVRGGWGWSGVVLFL